ncbi:MAG: glycosyltransferase [Thermoprotei archaeon]
MNSKFTREDVLEFIDKLEIPVNEKILELYLNCKLHSAYDVMSEVLRDQVVVDLNVGGYEIPFDSSKYFVYLKDVFSRIPVGYRFLKFALKYSNKYIGFLQHLGDLTLNPSLYWKNLFKVKSYMGGMYGVSRLLFMSLIIHTSWKNYLKKHKGKIRLLANSKGVFEKINLADVAHKIVFPIFALELDPSSYVTDSKEPYAVFFARPQRTKGIIEAVNVFKVAKARGCLEKIYIIGGAVDENYMRRLGLDDIVVNLGRLPSKSDVYKVISRASVSIYPSISDTFGITVLETIAVNTPVVMYFNPANYEIFSKSNLVKIVPIFDRKAMVDAVCKVAKNPILEPNNYTIKLIEQHKDWDRIVSKIEDAIIEMVET